MISRFSFGWQTTMADLALILFMVTAAGIHAQQQQQQREHPTAASVPPLSVLGEPLALYRAGEGAPPLGQWLAEQAPDRRQYLTIFARYRPGHAASASRKALDLAREAGEAGVSARIVLEPGKTDDLLATLAFDRPDAGVAQPLQASSQD